MEEADKDWMIIRMVDGWKFLLVLAHLGSPGQRAAKRLLCCCCYMLLWTLLTTQMQHLNCCLQFYDTVNWATGRTSCPQKAVPLMSKGSLSEQLANAGSSWKWLLKIEKIEVDIHSNTTTNSLIRSNFSHLLGHKRAKKWDKFCVWQEHSCR